jgi:chromosome segregation protein
MHCPLPMVAHGCGPTFTCIRRPTRNLLTPAGAENDFVAGYVARLVETGIRFGVITNHNKFDADEFKALRKRAGKEGIGLLPSVELSVADDASGVHTLIVYSDAWLANGKDYINQFLGAAFAGKGPAQYEHENGRTKDDLLTTLKPLEDFNRDFFAVFAHFEAASGLWHETDGGRSRKTILSNLEG